MEVQVVNHIRRFFMRILVVTIVICVSASLTVLATPSAPTVTKVGPRTTDLVRALLSYKDTEFQKCVTSFMASVSDVSEARIIEQKNVPYTEDGTLVIYSILGKEPNEAEIELQISPFEGGYDCNVVRQSKSE
jgi:hypothetical protein